MKKKCVYEETKMYFCYKLIININVKDKHLDILFSKDNHDLCVFLCDRVGIKNIYNEI